MSKQRRAGPAAASDEEVSRDVELELEILGGGATPAPAARAGGPAAGDPRRCILVADGDPALRAYIRRCVGKCSIRVDEVVEAADGPEALAAARARRFDLIVAEIALPRTGGLDVVAALRGDPKLDSTPVLLMAGETLLRLERERLERLRQVELLDKPFNARRMCKAVERLLAGQRG